MKYTKKMISEAPKFAVGIDYKASFKPLTIEVEMIFADDIYEAMAMCNELFDEKTVWCLNLYEKTDRIENDCIMYDEKMQSDRKEIWHLIGRDEFHVAYNPTWSDHEGVLC